MSELEAGLRGTLDYAKGRSVTDGLYRVAWALDDEGASVMTALYAIASALERIADLKEREEHV